MPENSRGSNDGEGVVSYLSDKTFKSGELVNGYGHLAHVVGHVGRTIQRIRDDGVRKGSIKGFKALAQGFLRLMDGLLQATNC